jgi:hypothetical protein
MNMYRMIVMCENEEGSIVPCEDVGRYETIESVQEWATEIINSGNAHYVEIYQNNEKVCTVYPSILQ